MSSRIQFSLLKLLLVAAAYGVGFRVFRFRDQYSFLDLFEVNALTAAATLGTTLALYVIFFRKPISVFLAAAAGGTIFSASAAPPDRGFAVVFGAVATAALAWLFSVARPPNQWRYE